MMIDANIVVAMLTDIAEAMTENKELFTQLDSVAGDGDLGISMEQGFVAVAAFAAGSDMEDLGKLLVLCAAKLNEASPSTLGTILSIGLLAGGKTVKGKTACGTAELAAFLIAGNQAIMERSKSAPGEKTVLDALVPAQHAVTKAAEEEQCPAAALEAAAEAAAAGCERTKEMIAVHGRAAYYAQKTLGHQDGGASVAKVIFESLARTIANEGLEKRASVG